MYWILIWLLLLILSITKVFGQSGPVDGDTTRKALLIRSEVLRLEEEGRLRALRGANNWDDMMARGAYLITPDGSVIRYEPGKTLPSLPLTQFRIDDLIARVFGETVVVTGLATISAAGRDGTSVSLSMRYMNIWRRVDGRWKMVVTQRTVVKPPTLPVNK